MGVEVRDKVGVRGGTGLGIRLEVVREVSSSR